jgi:hypothetical protein
MTPATQPAAIPHTLRLFKAEELAGEGRYREAEALLSDGGHPPEDPVLLHALATVVTRQGDTDRATRLWRLLQTRQPGHREAGKMLAAIETWQERPTWVRFAPASAAALLVLGLVLWAVSASRPAATPAPAYAGSSAAPLTTAPAQARPAPVPATRVTAVAPLPAQPARPTLPVTTTTPPPEEAPMVMFKVAPAKPAKK